MKFILAMFIGILFSSCTSGQEKSKYITLLNNEFYKNGTQLPQTKIELDSSIAQINRRSNKGGIKVIPQIVSEIQSGDSTIYTVEYEVRTINNKMIGKSLPDFTFIDLKGKVVKLSDLKGKPIVINLWFVKCPPCIAEMPTLNSIRERYIDTDIQFLSMTYEPKDKI
jgi:thiol-disulfide isomerase/thioredoxin